MNALSAELRARIARLRPDWDAAEVSPFIHLEGGYSNDNYRFDYRGERYVLRAPSRHRAFVDRELEKMVYVNGSEAGLPELVAFDVDSGDMISRWVPGTLLADRRTTGAELVGYLRRLHGALPPVDRLYDPIEQARQHLEHADAPRWVEALATRLAWTPQTVSTCHNDLNPWNIIHTPAGEWITLDWEWAGRNDPLFDLVTLHQGAGLADRELGELAEAYLEAPAQAERLEHCLVAFWLREATWAMAEIAAGNDRVEILEQRRVGLERLRGRTSAVGAIS